MRQARVAAWATWAYVAAFGIPAVPVSIYLLRRRELPTFLALSEMYGGPWSATRSVTTVVMLLIAFFAVTLLAAWSAWRLWKGRRSGGVLNLVLLPAEALFWIGFALPLPWLLGAARVALVASAWQRLDDRSA